MTSSASESSPPCYALCVSNLDAQSDAADRTLRRITLGENTKYAFRDVDLFASIEHDNEHKVSFIFSSHEDLLAFEKILYKLLDSTKGQLKSWMESSDIVDPDIDEKYRHFQVRHHRRRRQQCLTLC